MKTYNISILTIIALTLFFCVAAQSDCQSKKKSKEQNSRNTNKNMPKNAPDEKVFSPNQVKMKTLGEGTNSKIEKPFIFVVRSAENYAQMNDFAENLPPVSQFDFDKSAIVAAFAGTKNSGGYAVEIKQNGGKVAVELISPPKDAMMIQVLTTPYKIVSIPLESEDTLSLEMAENWQNVAETYKVSSGEFEYSGGFAGIVKKINAEGTIKILRSGDDATFIFDLSGKDAEKSRKLDSAASGKINDGKIEAARLDGGTFSEGPKPPVKVSGTLINNVLNLTFEPLPTVVLDGFQLRGKLTAAKNE